MSETGSEPRPIRTSLPDPTTASNIQYFGGVGSEQPKSPHPETHSTDTALFDDLRRLAIDDETTTEFGSAAYVSEFRSRTAEKTANAVDDQFDDTDYAHIDRAVSAVENRQLLCIDRLVGTHPGATFCCRLYVPPSYARIAHAWAKLFEPTDGREPDFVTVQLPDEQETAIRILPDDGFTAVLGSDYTGEAKKSFLRLFMYRLKQAGGLGLHAGSKRVCVQTGSGLTASDSDPADSDCGSTDSDSDTTASSATNPTDSSGEMTTDPSSKLRTVGQLFMGLSATGKSTLTAHGCWLEEPEGAEMVQDDVCALLPDGSVAGSEGGGLYVKTIDLDAAEQPGLHAAVTDDSAVLENVGVGEGGSVDFTDDRYTRNTRAVIRRSELPSASDDIDLEGVDHLFFITRNPLMPPVAKLDPEQAAVAFMLGESIETSAGDPERAGEHIRVVGTNPFIIGPEGDEGNRFRALVESLDLECFVLNTGSIGNRDCGDTVDSSDCGDIGDSELGGSKDIGVKESVTILTELARDRVEWERDDQLGLAVPTAVPGLAIEDYRVADYVTEYERALESLRAERRAYLESFDHLDEAIINAVY
ncbi:phosphoenolpyruvate carboxykinase (ATP) [Natrialbaceae archaeon A-CW1-1]